MAWVVNLRVETEISAKVHQNFAKLIFSGKFNFIHSLGGLKAVFL